MPKEVLTPLSNGTLEVVLINAATGVPYVAGGSSGGASDTTEATQLLVKTAVQDLDTAMGTVTASPTANTLLARVKDLLSLIVLAAGTNLIGKVGLDQTTPGTTNKVTVGADVVHVIADSGVVTSVTAITNALPVGANVIGKTSIDQTTPGTTDSVTIKASVGIGSLTETAPTTDTASSGLNGRLQRIAQNITSMFSAITTATLSNVTASATSVTILAANSNRRRMIVVNDSGSRLLLKFGATASATSFSIMLQAYDTYESPINVTYNGIIDGIWDTATGAARVTEMV